MGLGRGESGRRALRRAPVGMNTGCCVETNLKKITFNEPGVAHTEYEDSFPLSALSECEVVLA